MTDLAAATIAAAGAAVGELLEAGGNEPSLIEVDRVLSSGWFHIFPMPPSKVLPGYDAIQGGGLAPTAWMVAFEAADGKWLRAQASFATLQKRLADILGVRQDPSEVAAAIRKLQGDEVEADARGRQVHGSDRAARTTSGWPIPPDGRCMPSRSSTCRLVRRTAAPGSRRLVGPSPGSRSSI